MRSDIWFENDIGGDYTFFHSGSHCCCCILFKHSFLYFFGMAASNSSIIIILLLLYNHRKSLLEKMHTKGSIRHWFYYTSTLRPFALKRAWLILFVAFFSWKMEMNKKMTSVLLVSKTINFPPLKKTPFLLHSTWYHVCSKQQGRQNTSRKLLLLSTRLLYFSWEGAEWLNLKKMKDDNVE